MPLVLWWEDVKDVKFYDLKKKILVLEARLTHARCETLFLDVSSPSWSTYERQRVLRNKNGRGPTAANLHAHIKHYLWWKNLYLRKKYSIATNSPAVKILLMKISAEESSC